MKDLTAGSGFVFEDAGERDLKGVPDPWQIYRIAGQAGLPGPIFERPPIG